MLCILIDNVAVRAIFSHMFRSILLEFLKTVLFHFSVGLDRVKNVVKVEFCLERQYVVLPSNVL